MYPVDAIKVRQTFFSPSRRRTWESTGRVPDKCWANAERVLTTAASI